MEWDVQYDEAFVAELAEIERQTGASVVREEFAALALLLRRIWPAAQASTLRHAERVKAHEHEGAALHVAGRRMAGSLLRFDPLRSAILLVAGNKSGTNERRFYRQLIRTADARFDTHLQALQRGKGAEHG